MEHVRTQIPYALFICSISLFTGYIPVRFGIERMASSTLGLYSYSYFYYVILAVKRLECNFPTNFKEKAHFAREFFSSFL